MEKEHNCRVIPLKTHNSPSHIYFEEEIRRLVSDPDSFESFPPSDKIFIECEEKFLERFGPGFSWNKKHRLALIKLKHKFDLTDPEIRLLHYTGNLKRTSEEVFMDASGFVAAIGAIQLALIAGIYGICLMLLFFNLSGPVMMLKWCGLLLAVVSFCYLVNWTYIKPWRVQRRVMANHPAVFA